MAKKQKTEEKPVKEKKEKVAKIMYPGLEMGADGEATKKLTDWPADFDPKKHQRLRRKDFTNAAPFLEKRADRLEAKVKSLREEAQLIRTGGVAESKKVKKFAKLATQFQDQLKELEKELTPEQIAEFKAMFAAAAAGQLEKKDE